MATCKIGEFAKSKAGHDKEEIFIIINKEEEYVYLVDGKSRILDKPKKKKIKHIQPTGLHTDLINNVPQYAVDANIRREIKRLRKLI